MRLTTMAAVAAALFSCANPAQAQVRINMKVGRPENFNRVAPQKVGLNGSDRMYMQNAYCANGFEAKLGALAQTRASDPWVKDFGEDMYREHTLANSELKELAQKKGVGLSNKWPAMFVSSYKKMSNLSGKSFDNEFRKINKSGHMMVMNASAAEIKNGHDEIVRSYATKILAAARTHEQLLMSHKTMLVRDSSGSYGSAAQRMKP